MWDLLGWDHVLGGVGTAVIFGVFEMDAFRARLIGWIQSQAVNVVIMNFTSRNCKMFRSSCASTEDFIFRLLKWSTINFWMSLISNLINECLRSRKRWQRKTAHTFPATIDQVFKEEREFNYVRPIITVVEGNE
mmetsp:Transcript_10447/g.15774  ORF Transcript_10447/g.15774 Transcript_10447/m.15774 type:complete len:134 (-) Transcript_10447:51-452(-)